MTEIPTQDTSLGSTRSRKSDVHVNEDGYSTNANMCNTEITKNKDLKH